MVQVHVPQGVGVRVPPWAPSLKTKRPDLRIWPFCFQAWFRRWVYLPSVGRRREFATHASRRLSRIGLQANPWGEVNRQRYRRVRRLRLQARSWGPLPDEMFRTLPRPVPLGLKAEPWAHRRAQEPPYSLGPVSSLVISVSDCAGRAARRM